MAKTDIIIAHSNKTYLPVGQNQDVTKAKVANVFDYHDMSLHVFIFQQM